MVVEWLTFEIDPDQRAQWLQLEESVWSRFLETCEGFVRKQIWMEEGDLGRVHAVIWWESREKWFAVSADDVRRVDAAMGSMWRDCTMRVYDVIREC